MKSRIFLVLILMALPHYAWCRTPALQLLAERFSKNVTSKIQSLTSDVPSLVLAMQADQALLGHEGRLLQELQQLVIFQLEATPTFERVMVLEGGKAGDALENARRLGGKFLLRCVLGTKGKKLFLTADLYPLKENFWERMIDPIPKGASEHFFASVSMDREIAVLMGSSKAPPSLERWRLMQLLYIPRRILDLGMGDLDGDGEQELVLLLDDALEIYTIPNGGKVPKLLTEYKLNTIPESRVISRDPVGTIVVSDFNLDGKAEIFFNHFNRRYGQVLSWTGARLVALRRLEKNPLCLLRIGSRPVLVYGREAPGTNYFSPEVELADINSSKGVVHKLDAPFASLRCWQKDENSSNIMVVGISGDMKEFSTDWNVTASRSDCGAGASLADLDGDGRDDLVLSESVWPGEPDSIKVVSKGELTFSSTDIVGSVVAVTSLAHPEAAVIATVNQADRTSRVYFLGP